MLNLRSISINDNKYFKKQMPEYIVYLIRTLYKNIEVINGNQISKQMIVQIKKEIKEDYMIPDFINKMKLAK